MALADDLDRLVVRAQQGDHQAFHDLVVAAQAEVRLFAVARAPTLDLAEEAVQAGFVSAFEHLRDYQPRGTFLSWVKGIVLNRLREELRARQRHAPAGDRLDRVLAATWTAGLEKEDDATGGEEVARLRLCLERLAPRARLLLTKRYGDGLPVARLAQHLRQTEAAITGLLHRIRRTLRLCIEAERPS